MSWRAIDEGSSPAEPHVRRRDQGRHRDIERQRDAADVDEREVALPAFNPADVRPEIASVEPDESLTPAAAELMAYVPTSWLDSCFGGESHVAGATVDLLCLSPVDGVVLVELVQYDGSDPSAHHGAYGNCHNRPGDAACPGTRLDGDLIVGDDTIGSAGGCTGGNWIAFVLDDELVAGALSSDSFVTAIAAFVRYRPFPERYAGAISGPAFTPPATFAELKADALKPSYDTLVHTNASLQGERV